MAREVERKFLVRDDRWRVASMRQQRLTDGFVATTDTHKVRIRTYDARATVAIKTVRIGVEREEFEFPIPLDEARDLLAHHCGGRVLEKVRHYVIFDGLTWEIDVYEGVLSGIILAEVELPEVDAVFTSPPWIGQEVTFDPDYRNTNLMMCSKARARALTVDFRGPILPVGRGTVS